MRAEARMRGTERQTVRCRLCVGQLAHVSPIIEEMRDTGDVIELVESQPIMMSVLRAVSALGIDDCWVAAGLVRNAVWDRLHGYAAGLVPGADVDVIFCDRALSSLELDLAIERRLVSALPGIPWSVHNQARMYARNADPAYLDCEHAIGFYPETATAIAVRMRDGNVQLIAPHGVDDLLHLIVRPTPAFRRKITAYERRLAAKNWAQRWPRLTFLPA